MKTQNKSQISIRHATLAVIACLLTLGVANADSTMNKTQEKTDTHTHSHEHKHEHEHEHKHDHKHEHEHHDNHSIYKGYFSDEQIKDRTLSDWEGQWQSVYPHLMSGLLDPVMTKKAEKGDKTFDEYKAYYKTGYETDVNFITIEGEQVSFQREADTISANYAYDGYKILTYKKGNRGVRFVFKKTSGDEAAPQFIQFSDHAIFPKKADHFHLYWGDDREALFSELTNWPTYYAKGLTAEQILQKMLAH